MFTEGKELLTQLLRESNERGKALQQLVRQENEHGKKIIRARELYNMATEQLRHIEATRSEAARKANATRKAKAHQTE